MGKKKPNKKKKTIPATHQDSGEQPSNVPLNPSAATFVAASDAVHCIPVRRKPTSSTAPPVKTEPTPTQKAKPRPNSASTSKPTARTPSNPEAASLVGKTVKLHGLKRWELNGQIGTVTCFIDTSGRYEVKMPSTTIALKPENLEVCNDAVLDPILAGMMVPAQLSLITGVADKYTVENLPCYRQVQRLCVKEDHGAVALMQHAKRMVINMLSHSEINDCIDIKPFVADMTYVFAKDLADVKILQGGTHHLNVNTHLAESRCPEFLVTLESSQMVRLGIALLQKLCLRLNHMRRNEKLMNGTYDQRQHHCLADVFAALSLVLDGYLADEKSFSLDHSATLAEPCIQLHMHAEFEVVVPPAAGPSAWQSKSGSKQSDIVSCSFVCEMANVALHVMMAMVPSDIRRSIMLDTAHIPGEVIVNRAINVTKTENMSKVAHARLVFLRSFIKLQNGDRTGAMADLNLSLTIHEDQVVLQTQIMFQMSQHTMRCRDREGSKEMRSKLIGWCNTAHPDDRSLRQVLSAVAALCLLEGTEEAVAEGRAWFNRSRVAYARRSYLLGNPPDGGWPKLENPSQASGWLLELSKDAFDWENWRGDTGTLRRKYETLNRYLSTEMVKKVLAQVEKLRRKNAIEEANTACGTSTTKAKFKLGDAVVFVEGDTPTSREGTICKVPPASALENSPMYDVMVRGATADSVVTAAGSTLRTRASVQHVDECPICFDKLVTAPVRLTCRHEFCVACLDPQATQMLKIGAKGLEMCPLCRAPISKRDQAFIAETAKQHPETVASKKHNARYSELEKKSNPTIDRLKGEMKALEQIKMPEQQKRRKHEVLMNQYWKEVQKLRSTVDAEEFAESVYGGLSSGETPYERFRAIIANAPTDMSINDNDLFGDGDQSHIGDGGPGSPPHIFRGAWAEGLDFSAAALLEADPAHSDLSTQLNQACYIGSHKRVAEILSKTAPNSTERTQLLERRVSLMRFTPLVLVIQGERNLVVHNPVTGKTGNPVDHDDDYIKTATILLEAGSSPHVRDVLGNTVIFHCTSLSATAISLKIAKLVAAYGADPNIASRVGSLPLHEAAMSGRAELAQTLVDIGADPDNRDSMRVSPRDIAKKQALLGNRGILNAMTKKRSTEHISICASCGKPGAIAKCARCKVIHYCDRKCQKNHYKQHKKLCVQA
eukprot:m.169804 g.169804  ORF g.169804 m.169804 type:complete len:1172 (-) comp31590_c0_seq1:109-3624(-)